MNRSKFYFDIIKYLCLFGAFIFTNIVCACSMEKLNSIQRLLNNTKNNITEIKYNYNYLYNQKNKFLSLENDLKKCIKTQEDKIRNIQKVTQGHLNYNLFKTEKIKSYNDKIVILQNYITAYYKAITNINELIILIDEQIQDVKYFYDKQALKYSYSESIRNARFEGFRIKNIKQIFPFSSYLTKKYYFTINLFIFFLIITGIIFSLIFRKYEKQEKDRRKKILYAHLKWLLPFFIPIKGLKILMYFVTKDWLLQPNGFLLIKLVDVLISTDIAIVFYFYFFKQIPSFDKYKKILGICYKIIFAFLALGIMQFFRLHVFYESGISIQIFSILRTAIFFPFIAYQSINLILQLTNSSLWDKPKRLYFMVYRYLGISVIIIYFLTRTAANFLGYITFATSYLIWIIVTLIYYITFLSFQLSIQNSSNNKHLQFFNKIKALFSLNKEDNTFEFKMILLLINFLVLYFYIEYILSELYLSSYFIHQYRNFILENISIGKIKISILNLYEALILFSIIALFGKYLTQKINRAPKYRENLDKLQTVTKFIHYFSYTLASICALLVMGLTSTQLSFMIGSIGFGVGIGAQKILKDYFAGLVLLTKKNIHIDDYIQIGSNTSMSGKIQNIGALSTQILNDEQLLIMIPNSSLIDDYIIDYTTSDLINTCFINLKIKSFKDYSFLVKKIENLLLSFPEIYHNGPERSSIKILHSKKELSDEFISININFTIIEPSQKHFIFHKIKNKLFLGLKNEIYPI